MNLKELRQRRADKARRGREATIEYNTLGAKTDRTAEEDTRLTALDAEITALEGECEDLDSQILAEERSARRGTLFAGSSPVSLSTALVPVEAQRQVARTLNEPDPIMTGGFRSLTEFARSVLDASKGQLDPRLGATATNFHQNQGSGGEGYLVPPDYSREIWEMAFSDADLLGMSKPEPTASNAIVKPKDETTPWGAAGIQAYWGAEGAVMSPTRAQLTGEMMQLHKLYALIVATDEVLSDAPMLQNRLTVKAGQAIAWKASESIMWGDGIGKPLGIMNSPALITVAKESGQATATLMVANLAKMIARVLRVGGKPMWLANTDILPQLIQLTIGNVPAYLPYNQALNSEDSPFDGYLLGYPILFTEHAQTLGTAGDLTCINLSGYYSAVKAGGVQFASSIHLYFDQGLQAFRWTFRLAGQPYLSAPVSPARGTTTKSHFVTLASRP